MTTIRIETLHDDHECETCGHSYSEGANVYFDDVLTLELVPHAYCYDGDHYPEDVVLRRVIEALGHTVSFDGELLDSES